MPNSKTCEKKKRTDIESILSDNLFPVNLPASSLSPKPSGRIGVEPLSIESYIAAMIAMRVDALHAERQVYQPGLVPLSRTI